MKIFKTMKNNIILLVLVLCAGLKMNSQDYRFPQFNKNFDSKKVYKSALKQGIDSKFIEEYMEHKYYVFLDSIKKSLDHSQHTNDGQEVYFDKNNQVIAGPSTPFAPLRTYCPNASFDFLNFTNWTGTKGTVISGAVGASSTIYSAIVPGIFNAAGINTSVVNTTNYHTIMTTPPTNSVYPMCIGYDSIACKVIGGVTVSEIPVVNSLGGNSSVRMNAVSSTAINNKGSTLTYSMALNPGNKNFSTAYALILQNGGHNANEQPYFSVTVKDQNGVLIPGCSIFSVTINAGLTNTASPLYDPTWGNSSINPTVMYRKWSTVNFDMTAYPLVTSVTVEFFVSGCSQGGHYGYAYVDADCSIGGATTSFCAGTATAIVNAPPGYQVYSWVGPLGPVSILNGGNTASAIISPVTAGHIYTCTVSNGGGCNSTFQTTIAATSTSITSIFSAPSCSLGSTGSATVIATGSSSGYIYQWVNSLGTVVSNSQVATGLPPGTYTANVSAPACGATTETVVVGNTSLTVFGTNVGITCLYGSDGWASITPTGGSAYTYTWTNSLGAVVSNSQIAVGLTVGTYTGAVSSTGCGSSTIAVTVGPKPITVYGSNNLIPFTCNTAYVTASSPNVIMPSTNYVWYTPTGSVIPGAITNTITIVNPDIFSNYWMVYTTINGCRDSVGYSFRPDAIINVGFTYCQSTPSVSVSSPILALSSSFTWYNTSAVVIPGVTTPTYVLNNPAGSSVISVGYTTPTGCRDSMVFFGYESYNEFFVSDVVSICPGSSNSSAVLNMTAWSPNPIYNFTAIGPAGYSATSSNTSSATFSLTGMSVGVYTVTGNDNECSITQTFSVIPYVVTYSLSPLTPTICLGSGVQLTTTYCNTGSPTCALVAGATPSCSSVKQHQVGLGKKLNEEWDSPSPYCGFDQASHTQILYSASDLINSGIRPGLLTSLSFDVKNLYMQFFALPTAGHVLNNYTIKLKCTNTQSVTAFDLVGLSQVYTIPSYTVGLGVNTHSFNTNYSWDGVSNILVDICATPNGSLLAGFNPATPFSYASYPSIITETGSSNICGSSGSLFSTTIENRRPNTIFGNIELSHPSLYSYTWTPTTSLSPINSFTTFVNPTTTTVYSVQVQSVGTPNCTQVQSSTVTVVNNTITPIGAVIICNPSTSTLNVSSTALGVSTYTWSGPGIITGINTQTPTVNLPGTYTVSSIDAINGCSTTSTVAVTSNTILPVITSAISSGSITCSVLTSTLTGTSAGNTMLWNGGALVSATNPATVNATGNYTLTATNASNGCTTTTVVSVTSNTTLPVITSATSSGSITCTVLTSTLTGTSAGNTMLWNGGALVSATNPATVNATGNYTLTATNASNGCTTTTVVSVTSNTTLPVITSATSSGSITCTVLTSTLTGTSAGNTLTWNGGALINATNPATVIAAGNYTVTATNAINGCSTTSTLAATSNTNLPVITSAISSNSITCSVLTSTLTGTSAGNTLTWNGGALINATNPATVNVAGTYSVTATNTVTGCSVTTTVAVVASGGLPSVSVVAPLQITCIVPTITLTGSSVTPSVTYQWTGGAAAATQTVNTAGNYTLTVTNTVTGCASTTVVAVTSNTTLPVITSAINTGSITCTNTTSTLTGTSAGNTMLWNGGALVNAANPATLNTAGNYTVTATNASNGCTTTTVVSVTSNTTVPVIASAINSGSITCTNATSTLTGTSAGNTMVWNGGALVNATNPATVNVAGNYTVNATNTITGCASTTVVSVTTNTTLPIITSATSSGSITCTALTSTLTGTSAGNTMLWNGGALVYAANPAIVNSAGTYSVTATNTVTGCSATTTVGVLASGGLPSVSVVAPLQITCIVPTIALTGSSATPSVTYQWTGGAAAATQTVNTAGNYTLTVTNTVTGCSSSTVVTLTSNTTLPVITSATNSGSITCTVLTSTLSGTSAGNVLTWNGGALVNATNPATVNASGNYTLTSTNAGNGCVTTTVVSVTSNTTVPVITSASSSGAINCGSGSSTLTAISAGNTLTWNGGALVNATNPSTVSTAGNYTITSTSAANGCTASASASVSQTTINSSFTANPLSGTVPLLVDFTNTSNNPAGTSYSWNFGDSNTANTTNSSNTYTLIGNYTVTLTATDAASLCTATNTITIDVIENSYISLPNVFTPNGDNSNDVFKIDTKGIEELSCEIFNRWGLKIYTLLGTKDSWDGINQLVGTYFYILTAKGYDGKEYAQQGFISLFK